VQLLKASELAKKVGITRQQIHRLAKDGEIPSAKLVGKQFRFDYDSTELRGWIRARNTAARSVLTSSGEIPDWVKKGPPFRISKLAKDVGEASAAGIYVHWLAGCLNESKNRREKLSPEAKRIVKDNFIRPFVRLFNQLSEALNESVRIEVK